MGYAHRSAIHSYNRILLVYYSSSNFILARAVKQVSHHSILVLNLGIEGLCPLPGAKALTSRPTTLIACTYARSGAHTHVQCH